MKLPAYPKYKPSGVEWLGDVPEDWDAIRTKNVAGYCVSNVDKLTKDDEVPVRLCNYTDVYYNDHVNPSMELMSATATTEEIRKFHLEIGDVIITKDSEDCGDIGVPAMADGTADDFVCGYHLAIIHPTPSKLDGRFLLRCLQSTAINQHFQLAASGVTRYGIPKSSIGGNVLPLPPLPEQTAIADFLDQETSKLDTLIGKQRELIERLQEKRRALVSRCVTRGLPPEAAKAAGLDPHPKMKPSGVEWLGDVPDGWEVKKLSWLFLYKKGKNAATLTQEYIASNAGEFPVYSGQTANEGLMGFVDSYEFDLSSDAILVTTVGARAMTTRLIEGKFSLSQNCALIAPFADVDSRYYEGVLEPLFSYERGSISLIMQPSLRFEDLDRFYVPVPPKEEQISIANFLEAQRKKLDALMLKVEEAIDRLQEYRTALITAAVTGKIDVREVEI